MEEQFALTRIKESLKAKLSSHSTIHYYTKYNQELLDFTEKQPEDITKSDIDDYLQNNIKNNTPPRTLALQKSALKYFYHILLEKAIVKTHLPKVERKIPNILSRDNIKQLIDNSKHEKSSLIIKILYSTGLKVSELVNLRPTDINLETNVCWIKKTNRARDRTIKFPESLLEEIKNYIEKNLENEFLISKLKPMSSRNVQKIISRTAKRSNLENITPSSLRHAYVSHLLQEGVDIRTVKSLIGHSSSSTTHFIYSKPVDNQ